MNATQAKQRLADLTAEVAQARVEVTEAREAVSVGEATQKDVTKVLRTLERLQEREEQARTDLRVTERREQAEAATAAREADRIRRELDAITRAKRDAELDRFRSWLEAIQVQGGEFDAHLKGFAEQLRELGTHQFPSTWTSWQFLGRFVSDQLFRITRPTNYSQEG